tara:strand:+ start:89 stop:292 length:204 start_codon:yes stop_codon:yes gene_type:complete
MSKKGTGQNMHFLCQSIGKDRAYIKIPMIASQKIYLKNRSLSRFSSPSLPQALCIRTRTGTDFAFFV